MAENAPQTLRIASRESQLALAQSEWVVETLNNLYPDCKIDIVGMTTKGDQILDKPLAQIGGKGLFIKELEVAMEQGRADIAVHSMKDVPMTLPPGFAMTIVGEREDVHDAFVSNLYESPADMPPGAIVGTSSLRRESQLRHHYPALRVACLRGNVNTRLRKLDESEFDAIILASAGLIRLGLQERIRTRLMQNEFLPAIAQGALGIEYRADRTDLAAWLAPLNNPETTATVEAERALGRALAASCDIPLGAHARIQNGQLKLEGFVALPDGTRMIREHLIGRRDDPEALGRALAEKLLARGAGEILATLAA
ncbi:MAG: hydroxymethylbilane synthase [Betaproteobacteria bacterium]|nr:hydroxymethylbilane synthase [Betaproteobacteria bacterium]